MNSSPVLRLSAVAIRRAGTADAVAGDRLNVLLAAGDCMALTGPSGSGKTTTCLGTFGLAAGAVECRGRYALRGVDSVAGVLSSQAAQVVAFVFQEPGDNFSPNVPIVEQLRDAAPQDSPAAFRQAAEAMMQALGLGEMTRWTRRRPAELSRGEVQRFALVAALLRRPALLVADEPTAALDAAGRHAWCELVNRWRTAHGLAVWLATHDASVVTALSATVLDRSAVQGVTTLPAGLVSTPSAPADAEAPVLLVADALELRLCGGDIVVFTGVSGSGKTTWLEALAGRRAPPDGRVEIAPSLAAGGRSMVFQEVRTGLNPYRAAGASVVEILARVEQLDGANAQRRLNEELAEFDLAPALAGRLPAALSTGQAQRFALALALASRPRILYCDEPTSALGPADRDRVMRRLLRASAAGTALVVATHDAALRQSLLATGRAREFQLGAAGIRLRA